MIVSLSTRWNASHHVSGEAMIEEILALGFTHVELGYDLTQDLAPGVKEMVRKKAVTVDSVHAFCPVPLGAPFGHPELFELSSRDPRVRSAAASHLVDTVFFAAEVGAKAVVVHAGNTQMRRFTSQLIELCEKSGRFSDKYERLKTRLIVSRDRCIQKHLDVLYPQLEQLVPVLADSRVRLCIENLPSWESVPSEPELFDILCRFNSPWLGYWHDTGHAAVRQNLGLINAAHWLRKLTRWLGGLHVHAVAGTAVDHLMPPDAAFDMNSFAFAVSEETPMVLEPRPGAPAEQLKHAAKELVEAVEQAHKSAQPAGAPCPAAPAAPENRT